MNVKNVLVLGSRTYNTPWEVAYPNATIHNITDHTVRVNVEKYDTIQFTGGADVSPELYGEANTHSGNDPSRDLWEAGIFLRAKQCLVPCFGICRGSQFLRVMCGGRMIQDIPDHACSQGHKVLFLGRDGPREFKVTSTHHQQAVMGGNWFYEILTDKTGTVVEGWLFPGHHKVAGVQYHPEYMDPYSKGFCFYLDLIRFQMGDDTVTWEFD